MTSAIAANPLHSLAAPTIRHLDSGLTIIAEQMPIDAVNLNVWFRVGSAVESDDINGMAHFLEHMIFKGTSQLPMGEFERCVETRGGVTNAATSQDYTQFFVTTAPRDFATLAPLQIELVMNPAITDTEFERERPVILEEILRSHDNPRRRTFYRTMQMAFERLPYRRSVLGPAEVIETLTAHQMRAFHEHWYRPERITAVAVGNLPVETLIQTVANSFDQALAARDSRALDRYSHTNVCRSAPEAAFSSIARQEFTDPAFQQARLLLNWRVPGLAEAEQTHPLDVLSSVLGRGRTSRLIRDLRERRQLVSGISASNLSYWQQGLFSLAVQCPPENLDAIEAAVLEHVVRVNEEPITPAELQRVQTQVTNRYVFGSESPSDRAGLYGYYQTLTGNLEHALTYPEQIQRLTAEDIQAAAQAYLTPDAYGMLRIIPQS
jgi:predicted Zn-dependent peptidase